MSHAGPVCFFFNLSKIKMEYILKDWVQQFWLCLCSLPGYSSQSKPFLLHLCCQKTGVERFPVCRLKVVSASGKKQTNDLLQSVKRPKPALYPAAALGLQVLLMNACSSFTSSGEHGLGLRRWQELLLTEPTRWPVSFVIYWMSLTSLRHHCLQMLPSWNWRAESLNLMFDSFKERKKMKLVGRLPRLLSR